MGCLKCGKIKGEEKSHQIKGLKKESGGGGVDSQQRESERTKSMGEKGGRGREEKNLGPASLLYHLKRAWV